MSKKEEGTKEDVTNKLFTRLESGPGDGPDSAYTVLDSKTKKIITGTFVLCPSRDYIAFWALFEYFKILQRWAKTKEGLEKKVSYLDEWLERLESLWGMPKRDR